MTPDVNVSEGVPKGQNISFNVGKHAAVGDENVLYSVLLLIIAVTGVAFNAFILMAVPYRRFTTVRNVLLIHLGSLGLATSIIYMLHTSLACFSRPIIGGQVMCYILGYFQTVFAQTTTWTLAAISWNKYQTIVSPFQHSTAASSTKMIAMCFVVWVTALLSALPPTLLHDGYVYRQILGACFATTEASIKNRWYSVVLTCVLFYVPLCVILYSYAHIYNVARTQSSRIATTMLRMACVVQAPLAINGHAPNHGSAPFIKGTRAILTILQLIGTFVITYIPFSVILLSGICTSDLCSNVTVFFYLVFQAAPVTNSAMYGIKNKALRESFVKYVQRKIRRLCYKDKRRNSVKRSSIRVSFKPRKTEETPGLKRTMSLQAKHIRSPSPSFLHCQNAENIKRAQSFTVANGNTLAVLDARHMMAANEISNDSVTPIEMCARTPDDNGRE